MNKIGILIVAGILLFFLAGCQKQPESQRSLMPPTVNIWVEKGSDSEGCTIRTNTEHKSCVAGSGPADQADPADPAHPADPKNFACLTPGNKVHWKIKGPRTYNFELTFPAGHPFDSISSDPCDLSSAGEKFTCTVKAHPASLIYAYDVSVEGQNCTLDPHILIYEQRQG